MKATRLFDLINIQMDGGIIDKFVGSKQNDQWKFYSTTDVIKSARELASGLANKGVKKGDCVGIVVYKNRAEWVIVDLALQYLGAISVPMYATISSREFEYILNEAEIKMVFVGDGDLFDKLSDAQANAPTLKDIVCFDKQGGRLHWQDLLSSNLLEQVETNSQSITSDDIVTIIYTSGTTGNPKGVVLSHSNVMSIVDSCRYFLPINRGDKVLSFLPINHIFERAILYLYTLVGTEVYFTGTDNLGGENGDLANVKPHYFTTVPRLLEKVYEKIYNKGLELTGIKKKLFFWALSLTNNFEHDYKPSFIEKIKLKIADALIFSKWRGALGGNVRAIAVGAAACPATIARVFSAAGVTITEGYGLTETSPVISLNRFDGLNKIGTVGPVLDMVDLKFIDDNNQLNASEGEIVVAGPNIMQGYYKQPEQTASVFIELDGKRYFKTGDIGMLVDGPQNKKFLKITDRKKELFKTSGGKYVAPAPIEAGLVSSFLIEQAMVIGDNRKFVSAIIVPAAEALEKYCQEHAIVSSDLGTMIKQPKVIEMYQQLVDDVNKDLGHVDQIKKFTLVSKPWEPIKSDGTESELTPTLKLKRRVILLKHHDDIESMYA
jgi:long-chain acyl-CoA synthetase